MPYFETTYGRKKFSYTTLSEYEKALNTRQEKILPKKTYDFFGETITEIDIGAIKDDDSIFGNEFKIIEVLKMMLDNYENSDSNHSIVDFFNQNHAQNMVLRSRAASHLVQCHALQSQFKSYQAANAPADELLAITMQMKEHLELAEKNNNTSVAAGLSNKVLLEGEKAFEGFASFHDSLSKDINDTIYEVNELISEFE